MKKRCAVTIYSCTFCRLQKCDERHLIVECDQHEHSYDTPLFADAISEAMIHRFEVSR